MTKVRVRLRREHCVASAWWLRTVYVPFLIRAHRERDDALWDILFALDLIRLFEKISARRIRGEDAEREIDRDRAEWFGSLPSRSLVQHAPPGPESLLHEYGAGSLFDLGIISARLVLLTGITWETAYACGRAVERRRGRPSLVRKLEDVKALKNYGGDDEGRAKRRLVRKTAETEDYYRGVAALIRRAEVAAAAVQGESAKKFTN